MEFAFRFAGPGVGVFSTGWGTQKILFSTLINSRIHVCKLRHGWFKLHVENVALFDHSLRKTLKYSNSQSWCSHHHFQVLISHLFISFGGRLASNTVRTTTTYYKFALIIWCYLPPVRLILNWLEVLTYKSNFTVL